jgi:hypothetical protein
VAVSALRIGKNRHWFSVFPPPCSRHSRQIDGLFFGLDAAPFVRWIAPADVAICEPEERWAPKISIASATKLRDLHEAQSHAFADCWRHRVPMDAIGLEIVVGHR